MEQATKTNGLQVAVNPEATDRPNSHYAGAGSALARGETARPNMRPARAPNPRSFPFGAPPCRIYQPSRSVMQAGRAKTRGWMLEFEHSGRRWIEPLMGWTATDDAFAQVRLTFPTLVAAVAYAEREGLHYTVIERPARRPVRKDYRETIVGPGYWNGRVDRSATTAASQRAPQSKSRHPKQHETMEV